MTTEQQICEYLKDLPSEWRDKLSDLLIEIKDNKAQIECADVKECETLTSLSEFSVDGTEVSIQYKDENEVTVTRSFDVEDLLNNTLEDIDPNCLTSQSTWDTLSYTERIQLLIDSHCDCCEETTSTTTTTTAP